jgi:TRAP-type C4-dicarboxylate transport system substrate-binding protein
LRLALFFLVAAHAFAEPIRLRMAANAPEGTQWAAEFHTLAREIRDATHGQVEMKWYLGGIAGDEHQAHDRVQRGQLDGEAGALFCEKLAPSMRVGHVVGLFRSREEWRYVATRLMPELDREFAKSGFVNLGVDTFGNVMLFARKPLGSFEEVRRTRLWVYDLDSTVLTMLQQMGLDIVPGSLDQALKSYDDRRVDGFVTIPAAALAFQWSAYSRYYSDLVVGTLPGCIVVAQRAFDQLSLEQQKAVLRAAGKFAGRFDALGRMQDEALVGRLFQRQGLKLVPADERLQSAFFEAAEAAREKLPPQLVARELWRGRRPGSPIFARNEKRNSSQRIQFHFPNWPAAFLAGMRNLLLLSFVAACTHGNSLPPGQTSDPLTVHEWGTFTSMLGSTGAQLEGLHHEEERLPDFVHSRSPGDPLNMKGLETMPTGVTQKLETPVLYFYAQKAQKVSVHVDFPKGIVSQWYPDSSAFSPAIGAFTEVAGGTIDWQAQLTPGASDFPAGNDLWAPSRKVASMPLTIGQEKEQFIFYRGLGAFGVPFHVTAQNGNLTLTNDSSDAIPSIFLLELNEKGGAVVELGALAAGQTMSNVTPPENLVTVDDYVNDASTRVAAALEKSGLYADEARAMVDTWSKSYFRSQGLRILYVVPRPWTDQLLPIAITPKPAALVRTLVGRVEVLTPADEDLLSSAVQSAMSANMPQSDLIGQLGRFAEPKLRRVQQLISDPNGYLSSAIAQAQQQP